MGHFYISAAHKSSGKTTLSIGLCAALAARGYAVQPFKKGPDYIDPLWLGKAAGRPCYNLDFNNQNLNEIASLFGAKMAAADIGLIEGNKGLYDGMALDGGDSNAAMAKYLKAPVVLVLDVRGVTRGVAPLLQGYLGFDKDIGIGGVIFNQVAGPRQEAKLCQIVEYYTDLPVLGSVVKNRDMIIEERHLGLVPSNEAEEAESRIVLLRQAVDDQIDIERLLKLAATAQASTVTEQGYSVDTAARVRIGVARDSAFGFYYPDDLEHLQRAGAELVFFSPMNDSELPNVDGLFLGGGFPETHAESLRQNDGMLRSIKSFVEAFNPVYAECGGLIYLCRSLQWNGKVSKMADVIPADAVMYERPQGRGYVRLVESESHPWQGGGVGQEYPVHEFHYSRLENLQDEFKYAYRVTRGVGIDGEHDGLIYKNLLAAYAHQRHVEGNPWSRRFVDFVARCKHSKENA